jgi:hypothetical protein
MAIATHQLGPKVQIQSQRPPSQVSSGHFSLNPIVLLRSQVEGPCIERMPPPIRKFIENYIINAILFKFTELISDNYKNKSNFKIQATPNDI